MKQYMRITVVLILAVFLTACGQVSGNQSMGKKDAPHPQIAKRDVSTPLTVEEALDRQDGSLAEVAGFVTGQPVSGSDVLTGDFTNDYALALADEPGEADPEKMLFVQIPSSQRPEAGLKTNPDIFGKKRVISGKLTGYFSRPGLKEVTSILPGEEDEGEEEEPSTDPGGYYSSAEGLSGEALKSELHDIIDDHRELSYSELWDAIAKTDEDPDHPGNVILLYTGRSQDQALHGGDVDDWNREHVWAKSHGNFGTARGPGTDLHHLRPADVTVNSSRGNLDFDNGGSPHDEADGNFSDEDSWEPRDEVKGDVARMLFYMAVRYEGDAGEVDLELNDRVNNGKAPNHGRLSVLLDWHESDPVDDRERRRNEIIYEEYQGNRNPFIDHPEWAEQIW
ncbi:Ribonuclease [Bacillus sp. 349Y]|nr:Ribonuclease [Bacillus sp. 349Y]